MSALERAERRPPKPRVRSTYKVDLLASVRRRRTRHDRDFLPTALEILERPPSPIRMSLLYAICACFAFALLWSCFGHIDEYATATGKVEAKGRTKVVQPLVAGKVIDVPVGDGTHVEAGAVLLRLDPSQAAAALSAATGDLMDLNVEIARRAAAIRAAEGRRDGRSTPAAEIVWRDDVPGNVRRREEADLEAEIAGLDAAVASLSAQVKQQEAERAKVVASIASETALIAVLSERVDMRSELAVKKDVSRAQVLDALQGLRQAQTSLVSLQGGLAGTAAAIEAAEAQIRKTVKGFIADNADARELAQKKVGDLVEQVEKARVDLADMTLTAPTSGTVQAMAVTTIGQVVTTGQELLTIVPDDTPLEIEAYILNQDAGFVKEGQRAVIKVDALPFTRYGTIEGRVTYVARDAIPGLDAAQQQSYPSRAPSGSLSNTSAAQRTQDLVFPIRIRPSALTLDVDGRPAPISPGMTVNVEVQTETRRLIDYILSPIEEIGSTALRER